MKKLLFNKKSLRKIIYITIFAIFLALYISANINGWNEHLKLNWFAYIFISPFVEITRILNSVFSFSTSYMIAFLISLIPCNLLVIVGRRIFDNFTKSYKEMIMVFKDKTTSSEEHIDEFFNIFEKNKISLGKVFAGVVFIFLQLFFVRAFLSALLSPNVQNFMNVDTYDFLWFNLLTGEKYPILFVIYIIQSYGISLVRFIKNYFFLTSKQKEIYKTDFEIKSFRANEFYTFLVSMSFATLSLYFAYVNVSFAIFIILTHLITSLKTIFKK